MDPRASVKRLGLDNSGAPVPDESPSDWRIRTYLVWFCYIYENFLAIEKPLYAVEELILEFKGLYALDPKIGSLYAGAGGWGPVSLVMRESHLEQLKPIYLKVTELLDGWKPLQE